eukprot:scaffold1954_cov268-Pinguiococcus_pyrenoidosus.AAC.86
MRTIAQCAKAHLTYELKLTSPPQSNLCLTQSTLLCQGVRGEAPNPLMELPFGPHKAYPPPHRHSTSFLISCQEASIRGDFDRVLKAPPSSQRSAHESIAHSALGDARPGIRPFL